MASCLPPMEPEPEEVAGGDLSSFLEPTECVEHLGVGGQSEYVEWPSSVLQPTGATRIGSLWIRGPEGQWMAGECLKFRCDHRPWRILEATSDSLKLIFDSRSQPKFRWVYKSELSFCQRHWLEWLVHSLDGYAKAIRHTEFAPGDLYLDSRGGSQTIRPLSGLEKWRMMGLSEDKAAHLIEEGYGCQLG